MIDIHFEEIEVLDLNPEFFVSWLFVVCEEERQELGNLNLIFCSDDYLLQINKKHLNHDYYTDIITFDYTDEVVSGDLFISIDRVRENAKTNSVEFLKELYRVIVHGTLHLLGYADKSASEAALMRQLEDKYLLIVPRETID
ncbi:MAG TPA: rRNA maturation RNase YbeY [Crocinitomicaceae bacterium]|nr:rRNA maturation RNase YbeY [Crocinitomicaceae bacterium]